MKKDRKHWIANGIFLCIIVAFLYLFIRRFSINIETLEKNNFYMVILILAVIAVNLIKMLRLYVILFGNKFKIKDYMGRFCLTSFINCIMPYKCGEIYRGYCIGDMINSYFDGYIIVIFDRFVDTLALISIVICVSFLGKIEITSVYIWLTVFLILVMLGYWIVKSLYQYWNHFLIFKKSSKHTLKGLRFLDICNKAIRNISLIVKGRFVIVYLLSLVAWAIEIGILFLAGNGKILPGRIGAYLQEILTGKGNTDTLMYTAISLLFFVIVELILLFSKKERNK